MIGPSDQFVFSSNKDLEEIGRVNKPIKVLHITNVEKANYYLTNLADHSCSDQVNFVFATFAAEDCEFVQDVKSRGRNAYGLDALSRTRYPQAFRSLNSLLAKENPDIVHTHLFDPSVIGLTVAKRHRRPTVLTRHHSDAIHAIASPFKKWFYLGLENYISRLADHIIAPSKTVREFLIDVEGVSDRKVSVIPYGQTTERFDLVTAETIRNVRAELQIGKKLSLVNVSRLYDRKGHRYLFEAFSCLIKSGLDAELFLVGEGSFRPALEVMCSNLGISDRVKFLGWRRDALSIVAACDIVVHPSLEDALSSAIIETVMLGRPIVATDISGARDSLGDGRYGKIVTPANAAALKLGLEETIKDIEGAKKRAAEGRVYLLDYMDAERVSAAHVEIYRRLANST